ncbi:MAG: right-handed parallel beta-helix repeat-containing protein, partial [Candidatus Hodarchaeota archaeon]
ANSTLFNNTVTNNERGISLVSSGNSILSSNIVTNNSRKGIHLEISGNNTIVNNILRNNSFSIAGLVLEDYIQTKVTNNSINDSPLIYWQHVNGSTIPSGTGQVILVNCTLIEVSDQILGGVLGAYCSRLFIQKNVILNGNYGIRLDHSNSSNIFDNNIMNNGEDGIYFEYSRDNSLSGNTLTNNSEGISLRYSKNNSLLNNTIMTNFLGGIYTRSSENNYLINNTVANNKDRGIFLASSNNCSLTNNTVINNDGRGIFLSNSKNNTLFNNIITHNSMEGIYLSYSESNNLTYNVVAKNNLRGIYISNSEICTLFNNNITNNNGEGIILYYSEKGTLHNNTVTNNIEGGISLVSSGNSILSSNIVTNDSGEGIYLEISGNNTIINNILRNNSFSIVGLVLEDYIQTKVTNNTINDLPLIYWQHVNSGTVPSGTGQVILVNCTLIEVSNQILGGVLGAYCSRLFIQKNVILNGRHGIRLDHSRSSILSGNNIANNNEKGIFLENSRNCTLISNTVSKNSRIGIYLLYSLNNSLLNNKITHNNEEGIFLSHSEDCILTNNIISHNNDGVWLYYYSRYNKLTNNMITNNTGIGIQFWASFTNIFFNNTVTNNSEGGIFLYYSYNNTLFNNIVASNYATGIHLQFSSKNVLSGNTIANNSNYGIYTYMHRYHENNKILYNNFHKNNGVNSQACNNGWINDSFVHNYWDDWTGTDANGDGIIDQTYPIEGNSNNFDHYPLVEPSYLMTGLIIHPTGGEFLTGNVTVRWTPIFDSLGRDFTYSIFYSADEGITWILVQTGLTTLNYSWDTTNVADGSQYMIKIHVNDLAREFYMDSSASFTIDNLSHFQSFTVLSPSSGDILFGPVIIQWTPAVDIFNHEVNYTISYSADNGYFWIILVADLTNLSYVWDSTEVVDGSQYLIQVNASCSEGAWRVATSNSVFTIENVPHTTSLPPTHTSDSSIQTDTPIDLLPIFQILGLILVLFFIMTLVIIFRRQQMS